MQVQHTSSKDPPVPPQQRIGCYCIKRPLRPAERHPSASAPASPCRSVPVRVSPCQSIIPQPQESPPTQHINLSTCMNSNSSSSLAHEPHPCSGVQIGASNDCDSTLRL